MRYPRCLLHLVVTRATRTGPVLPCADSTLQTGCAVAFSDAKLGHTTTIHPGFLAAQLLPA